MLGVAVAFGQMRIRGPNSESESVFRTVPQQFRQGRYKRAAL